MELTPEQKAIVERYTTANAAVQYIGMTNVANLTHEKRVALNVRSALARAEQMAAHAAYEQMIAGLATRAHNRAHIENAGETQSEPDTKAPQESASDAS